MLRKALILGMVFIFALSLLAGVNGHMFYL